MFANLNIFSAALALSIFFQSVCAGVIWMPEDFDPLISSRLAARDGATCGGLANLASCGASFPSDFCCPEVSSCMPLNGTASSQKAVICCPAGQDCSLINPVSCDQNMQNATTSPSSELHSDPTQELKACGQGCCPFGYSCKDGQCLGQAFSTSATSSGISSSTATSSSTTSSTRTSTSAAASTPPAISGSTSGQVIGNDPKGKFSGTSFAAGFVPGIAIGAFLAACLLLLLFRKKRRGSSYLDEKTSSRDTLTELTLKPLHNRSISDPIADPYAGRTEFLRSTPPRGDGAVANNAYSVYASRPITPGRTPKIKNLFSHSPFMDNTPSTPPRTQPPVPAHMKRGTLNFKISPVRGLKKQKSMHSLRRQMNAATTANQNTNNTHPTNRSPNDSQETIKVLWPGDPTPAHLQDQTDTPQTLSKKTYQPPSNPTSTSKQWTRAFAAPSSLYSPQPLAPTPTRAPGNTTTSGKLGTPYTPSRYGNGPNNPITNNDGAGADRVTDVLISPTDGLRVVRGPETAGKRDTTFSAMMERAGLRKSDLFVGSDRRRI